MHGFSTTLQRVVAARLRNRIYRERRLNILFFHTMCMYVRLIQIACIYIVTKRVENSNSPGGLVQAKGIPQEFLLASGEGASIKFDP